MAVPNSTQSREQEPEAKTSQEFGVRERERVVPVRTEQERIREQEETEIVRKAIEEAERVEPEQPSTHAAPPPVQQPVEKDPLTREVEEILSEDLSELYGQLTPNQRAVFKREGEQLASKIRVMLEQVKVRAHSLLDLIRRWLRLIPGVNKFFLEQEAKIKADKVLGLHSRLHPPQQ